MTERDREGGVERDEFRESEEQNYSPQPFNLLLFNLLATHGPTARARRRFTEHTDVVTVPDDEQSQGNLLAANGEMEG